MEPLAHTLAGACLAETGLKRLTPLATSTLVIAANLADLDGACYLHSADLAFGLRRGLTHGALAWVVLPALLAAAMLGIDRHVRRRRHPDCAPARAVPLLGLALLGFLSHPLLDWLNSYGVRLLMPFSDRWFYGDTLFIVDPWLWLMLGSAVMLAWTATRRGVALWIALAAGTTLLVVFNPLVPSWARVVWLVSLCVLLAARIVLPARTRPRVAIGALLAAALYVGLMYAGSRVAERQVAALAAQRGWIAGRIAAMPVPAEPTRRVVIVETATQYLLVHVDWVRGPRADSDPAVIERGAPHPAIQAALDLPSLQGTRRWLRFPSYQVVPAANGAWLVIIRDARFSVGTPTGFGVIATVLLDRQFRPLPPPIS
ncbi:MAG: metal-dependent hydrolase [Acidobacteriota bacterium]